MFDFHIDKHLFVLYNTNTERMFVSLKGRRIMRIRASKQTMRKRIRRLSTGIVMILFGCMVFGSFFVSAHENTSDQSTYYKSIEIQPGDTLWDIAEETMTSKYNSVPEYVQALKDMNNLDSDDIQAGQYLVIAYNDTDI